MSYSIFKVGKHKKASLSLSINAIVILVLAIAMLGLGLSFTKGMFKKFGEKLTVPPPDIPATAEEPIILPTDVIEVQNGKEYVFQVNFYNDHPYSGKINGVLSCYGDFAEHIISDCNNFDTTSKPEPCSNKNSVISRAQNVDPGTYKPFKFIITPEATRGSGRGQDVCTIQFNNGNPTGGSFLEEKQIVIKVK